MSEHITDAVSGMEKSIEALRGNLSKMRTGRASPTLLEKIHVDYYGSRVPLNQVANVTTPDARTLQVVAWEQNIVPVIEKAILAANLGVTPQNDGKVIRITIPPMTEDRRKDVVKLVKKAGEEAKIAIRGYRRDANDNLKKSEKGKEISEDDLKKMSDQVQKETDQRVSKVDDLVAAKEKEVMTV